MMRRANLYRLRTVWTDDILNGIFAHLQNLAVPWKNLNIYGTLDLEYHGNHSGDKIVSPVIDRYLDAADDEKELTEAQKTMLAAVCFNLYGSKWDKLYNILSLEYNPISNYDMTEQETTNESGENSEAHAGTDRTTNTGTVQDAKTGTAEKTNTGTETTEYTDEVERSGTDQKRQTGTETVAGTDQSTTSGTSSIENGIAGFNSNSYKDSTNSDGTTSGSGSLTRNETRTPNLTENGTTSGTETLDHSETRTPNLTEESEVSETATRTDNLTQALTHGETVTGSDEREITRELTRSGNIGVTTSQQMIQSEIELWQWNFFETVFNDIDTVLTIQVY